MFENDDIDFYFEQNNPEQSALEYKTQRWIIKNMTFIEKTNQSERMEKILVYDVKVSQHGPM